MKTLRMGLLAVGASASGWWRQARLASTLRGTIRPFRLLPVIVGAIVGAAALMPAGRADAGTIEVTNFYNMGTPTSSSYPALFENIPAAQEGADEYDWTYDSSSNTSMVALYSKDAAPTIPMSDGDRKPINTQGWYFDLATNKPDVVGQNDLVFRMVAPTNLNGNVAAYDLNNPGMIYTLDKSLNGITTIHLADLVGQPANTEYAHWRIETNYVPEPSTLTLLGIGAGVMAFGWRRQQKGDKSNY